MTATLSRRAFFSAGAAGILSSCGQSNIGLIGDTASLMWGSSGTAYNTADARKLPYATLDAKLGKPASALLVLGEVDNQDRLHWFSADRAQIITDNLRVLKTAGLPSNLTQTIWLNQNKPSATNSQIKNTSIRMIDLSEENIFGLVIDSESTQTHDEEIDIFGKKISTRLIVEKNEAKSINWKFENYFWQDKTGFVWKSEQIFSPTAPPLILSVLKPYAKN